MNCCAGRYQDINVCCRSGNYKVRQCEPGANSPQCKFCTCFCLCFSPSGNRHCSHALCSSRELVLDLMDLLSSFLTDLIAITRGSGCEAAQNLQPRVRFIQLTTMCLENWMFKISLQCAGLRQTGTPSGGL